MAIDQLIEDGDDYYYVDINGVMASNQWVAIENEDAGNDDEPDQNWYYFQANGKALKNGDNSKVALKTINGKIWIFGIVFKIPSAKRRTLDVDCWSENNRSQAFSTSAIVFR